MRRKTTIAMLLAAILTGTAFGVPTQVVSFYKALPGTSPAMDPGLAGTTISKQVIAYSTLPGSLDSASGKVVVSTVKGADGRLGFYWRIVSDAGSKDVVHALELYQFPKRVYDANWRTDGPGTVKPVLVVGRNPAAGWRMEFVFRPTIHPGQSSRLFFLRAKTTGTQPAILRIRFENGRSAELKAVAPAR